MPELSEDDLPKEITVPAIVDNLSSHVPVFVGREWELSRIQQFLDREKPVEENQRHCQTIMVVYGPRGVGKKTLVRQAALNCVNQGRFRLILWSDREAFASLVSGGFEILPSAAENLMNPFPGRG